MQATSLTCSPWSHSVEHAVHGPVNHCPLQVLLLEQVLEVSGLVDWSQNSPSGSFSQNTFLVCIPTPHSAEHSSDHSVYNHCELSILVEIAFVCGDLVVHGPKSQASWVIGFSARLHVGPCVTHVALLVLVPGPQVVEHVDHVPTLHCGGGNVVGATFDSSSQRGISQTSEVGRILGSTQAPSAILIINDAVISCTHSMLLERVPLPQVTEQRLHGPALHLGRQGVVLHRT